MPIINHQPPGRATQTGGTENEVNPVSHLILNGPAIQVTISIFHPIGQTLTARGIALPEPVTGIALIDTGASGTCIDDDIAQQMGLPVIDRVRMMSASHESVEANCYPVHFDIGGSSIGIDAPSVVGARLASQSLVALIGRDVLANNVLIYNGQLGSFTFAV